MSAIARIGLGIIGVAAAFLPGVGPLASAAVFSLGSSLVLGGALEALAGRPGVPGTQRQGVSGNVRGTTEAHNVVFGRVRVGGVLQALGTTGADNQFAWYALANSITHPGGAEGIGRIWVDETEVLESEITASATTDSLGQPATHYEVTGGRFAGLIRLTFRRGTATQGADANLSGIGGIATDYARGVAMTTVRLFRDVTDEEAFQMAFQGRVPQIAIELLGNRVYDPRLDSTAGGAGPQRVADPTTWAWSDNAALCAATYTIMAQSDGGEGQAAADVDWFSVAAAANVCDQVPTGGGRLYRCAALLTTAADRRENTAMLLDAMQGARAEVGTLFTFFAGAWRIPSFAIDETWLRGPATINPRTSLSAAFNQVRISSLDRAQGYQKIEVPTYVNPAFEAQDGGRRLVRDMDFPTCADVNQAQRMGALIGRKSRRQMSVQIACNWRGMTLETWETGTITLPGRNFAGRTFRVMDMEMTEEGPNVTLMEDAAGDYDGIMPQAVVPFTPPTIAMATPAAPTGLAAIGSADGIDLSWSVQAAWRDEAVIVFRKPGAPEEGGAYVSRALTFGTTWRDVDTEGGTFSYRVRVRLRSGQQSADSNTASATAAINGISPELMERLDVSINPDGTLNAGSVSLTQFANGIQPVGVVDALPSPAGYAGPDVVFSTFDLKLYRYTGSGWTAAVPTVDLVGQVVSSQIADAAINTAKFASGIQPVSIVASLPSPIGYAGPRTVLLTSDNKLYRYTGSAWTAAVPAGDLAGQITTTQISDNAITTGKIAANAITAAQIAADTITAGQIAAGAISASEIAARAITASKILVSDTSNLIFNPEFKQGLDGWIVIGTPTFISTADGGPGDAGLQRYRVTMQGGPTSNLRWGRDIEVQPGETYLIKCDGFNLGASAQVGIYYEFRNNAGALVAAALITLPSSNVWVSPSAQLTVPAGAKTLVIVQYTAAPANAHYFTNFIVRRSANAELIVDGAVIADKIAANAVTADKVAANAITAGKIAANAVTAGTIQAGAISTTQLAANAVTAANIAAGTITTSQIQVGAATAAISASVNNQTDPWPTGTSSIAVNLPTIGFTSTSAPRKILGQLGVRLGGALSTALPAGAAFANITYGLRVAGEAFTSRFVRTATTVRGDGGRAVEVNLSDISYSLAPPSGTAQIGFYIEISLTDSAGAAVNVTSNGTSLLTRYTLIIEENKV